jgi:hypothetical protein
MGQEGAGLFIDSLMLLKTAPAYRQALNRAGTGQAGIRPAFGAGLSSLPSVQLGGRPVVAYSQVRLTSRISGAPVDGISKTNLHLPACVKPLRRRQEHF